MMNNHTFDMVSTLEEHPTPIEYNELKAQLESRLSGLRTELKRASKIVTKKSPVHGYGVFATEDILKYEIIEEGTFKFSGLRTKDLIHTPVRQFLLTYSCLCKECKIRGEHFIFTTGCAIQYNSAAVKEGSFIRYQFDVENGIITTVANKDIKKGEELLAWHGIKYYNSNVKAVEDTNITGEKNNERITN